MGESEKSLSLAGSHKALQLLLVKGHDVDDIGLLFFLLFFLMGGVSVYNT